MTFESKYTIGDTVAYHIPYRKTIYKGIVVGITFTAKGVFYDVDIRTTIAKGVPETQIEENS